MADAHNASCRLETGTPKLMEYAQVGDVKYPKVRIVWRDIIGDPVISSLEASHELVCPTFITEGFLFDVFEGETGERYVRTFASYQTDGEAAFGDRNCFPFCVLTHKSKRDVEIALLFMD